MRGQSFVKPSWNTLVKNILDTHSAVKMDMGKLMGKDHFVQAFRTEKNEMPPKGKTTQLQIEPVCALLRCTYDDPRGLCSNKKPLSACLRHVRL